MVRCALVLALAAGCARPVPEPQSVLGSYVAALERDDPCAAWTLLARPVRIRISEAEFTRRWRESPDERRAQAARLRARLAAAGPDPRAALTFPDGSQVALVREERQWRMVSATLGDLHAATPEEALRHFVTAVESRRYDLLLGILADPLRGEVERQVRERLERLRAALDRPHDLEVNGDRARFQYDPRFRIDLQRQNGEWRVYDLN
jgi:hypothetical protein